MQHRILKIAPTSFFADYGCHVRIYEETRVLQKLGHQVVICTYHTGRDLEGVEIRRALNTPWAQRVRVGSNLHKLYHDALLALKSAEVAVRWRPTVIHAHLHEGALIGFPLGRLLGAPLVFDFQGSLTSEMLDHGFISRDSLFFHPLRRLEGLIDGCPNRIITSSRNASEVLIRDFSRPPSQVATLPDSVDTDLFRPRREQPEAEAALRLRRRLGIPDERCLVVYLGLLAGYQGTGLLLEAAAQLTSTGVPVHFLIMGFPGEDSYRTQAEAMGLGDQATFTGRIPYEDAPLYLSAGDIAVSPKISETEGNGKLLNYMACGLPTVAFNTPVAREILGDLGCYAETGDATDLARALRLLAEDPEQRDTLSRALRARAVSCYSWDSAGRQLLGIYDELTAL